MRLYRFTPYVYVQLYSERQITKQLRRSALTQERAAKVPRLTAVAKRGHLRSIGQDGDYRAGSFPVVDFTSHHFEWAHRRVHGNILDAYSRRI